MQATTKKHFSKSVKFCRENVSCERKKSSEENVVLKYLITFPSSKIILNNKIDEVVHMIKRK